MITSFGVDITSLLSYHYHKSTAQINAPQGSCIWLRLDLSLVVAAFVAASCRELDIPTRNLGIANAILSPFGPLDM